MNTKIFVVLLLLLYGISSSSIKCPTKCLGLSGKTGRWGAAGCPPNFHCLQKAGANGCLATYVCEADCPTKCRGLSGRTDRPGNGCPTNHKYDCIQSTGTNGCPFAYACVRKICTDPDHDCTNIYSEVPPPPPKCTDPDQDCTHYLSEPPLWSSPQILKANNFH
jgi:hypothetical protein